ncbi:MAG TPA: pyridoxal phosphate-dependent aminotransferase [Thermoanaerobaculia bacterium]|nr:pyridoxal phosphate-dependent aminotransferase [Thermoanaerobaculia bacterium]
MKPAHRFDGIEISLIRQINALATPFCVNLGIGEPNIEPDDTLREMARRATAVPWRYSANAGNLSLRKKLAQGTGYDPKTEVCITAGTEEALYAIFQAYVDPGDEVLIPNPGFSIYATLAQICGAKIVTYDLAAPDWKLDVSKIPFSTKTKLIVVNSPSNPLGSVLDDAALDAIAAHPNVLIVSDEVYRELWYDERSPSMLGRSPNAVVVNGMSKSHSMTGLRLGWIMAREDVMKPIVTAHQYIATCASVFSQALAEMILDNTEWNAQWLENNRAQLRRQRDAALHAIERELGPKIPPPQGAFYAFVPSPECDTLQFAKDLAGDAAVVIIPGIAFGSLGEGFVRISFAASLDQIGSGIERIGRYLRSAGR